MGGGGIEEIFRKEKIRFECWLYSTLAINLMLTQQNGFFLPMTHALALIANVTYITKGSTVGT